MKSRMLFAFALATFCFANCTVNAADLKKPSSTSKLREDQVVAFHQARVASRPDDADAWRMLAGAYVARAVATGDGGDYDRGWKTLDKAEALFPGDPRVLEARADLLLSRHHFKEARLTAEQGLAANPENEGLLAIAGDGALETGDLDAATAYYRKLRTVSVRLTTFARLAHVAEMRGNLDEAAEMLEKALASGYEHASLPQARAWCRAVLGEVELHRGHNELARKQYQMGLEESPNHLLVLEHFGELEQAEGHFDLAEALFRKILVQKEDPKAELRVAALLEQRGKKLEAAKYRAAALGFYRRAVASGNEGYLRPLAVFELSAGNFEKAESLEARDVALRPTAEARGILQFIQDTAAARRTAPKVATSKTNRKS
jgi:tetratricopeptide (TPR) repeat protein